jgi:hypothetical protein
MRLVSGPKLDITVESLGVGSARRADPGRTGPLGRQTIAVAARPKLLLISGGPSHSPLSLRRLARGHV